MSKTIIDLEYCSHLFSLSLLPQLTIIFKNFQECVDQKMYHAETDELPAAFADGSKNGGDRHGANTLRIVEKVPGQHMEIQARYIGTTIVVRQVGHYLTFAVRMPEEVVNSVEDQDNQDLYLCLHGCPANQRIDFRTFRARAAESQVLGRGQPGAPINGFTYQSAMAKCKERLPVEDLYFQSCVFDLLSSGDINFTLAAYYAFEDVKMLHSNKNKYHLFEKDTIFSSASEKRGFSVLILISLVIVLLWTDSFSIRL
uniref:Repulsive guidance molecule BMP co-receptor a n=1 Tax=Sinocyclocheilus grahami TaxID=75366 RepID=A0A672MEP5_SINGR